MNSLIQVAVAVRMHSLLDYQVDKSLPPIGGRVVVPFGKRQIVGIVMAHIAVSTLPTGKIKCITRVIDHQPILSATDCAFIQWASQYYHEPIGLVASAFLPSALRQVDSNALTPRFYRLDPSISVKGLSSRQKALYALLEKGSISHWGLLHAGFREATIQALIQSGCVQTSAEISKATLSNTPDTPLILNTAQQCAVDKIRQSIGFAAFLLDGVTGSGKTQVYIEAISAVIAAGKQALVLLPEIGLTPQTVARFQSYCGHQVAVMHSRLSDVERTTAWMLAHTGEAPLVIGTRSALFASIPRLGIMVVDEEHDSSFKQQSGFRYSARDLAVIRAKKVDIPVVLGSATPALESIYNAKMGRYTHLVLSERAGGAVMPKVELVDLRGQSLEHGLAPRVIRAIGNHLAKQQQVLLFLNRRGYAPVWLCHSCGWSASCTRCDSHFTYYKDKQILRCHKCQAQKKVPVVCEKCGGETLCDVGMGTEKLADGLASLFPDVPITRVDRDSISAAEPLEKVLASAYAGVPQILVGTQMLAKGHHLPDISLVVILDADGALYSSDFRATEKMLQTVVQVAGRSGREAVVGSVLVQTHLPDNQYLQCATQSDYHRFSALAMTDRSQASMPPFASLALLHAEALVLDKALQFLQMVCQEVPSIPGVTLLGPMRAILPKKSGKYRAYLVVHGMRRAMLQQYMATMMAFLGQLKSYSTVRWAIDVDPLDMP